MKISHHFYSQSIPSYTNIKIIFLPLVIKNGGKFRPQLSGWKEGIVNSLKLIYKLQAKVSGLLHRGARQIIWVLNL